MKFLKSALCVVMLLVAAPLLLCAQQSGVLSGTVHDSTGAVIQGASVVVSGNGIQNQTATTDALGAYTFSSLPPGNSYTVVINSPGFQESRSEYVNVSAGETTPMEVTLAPAGVETVEQVHASGATQVETETAEQSGTLTEKQVVTYGLNGRNFSQLIALAPGVSNQTGQDEAKVGVSGSAKYSVNGGRVEYNAFDVDGSDVLNTGINASKGKSMPLIVYPSLDAIQEVKVLTSNYGAQYGRSASGSVLVTTKSGTSDFHGNGYEFFRNEIFNARNYFDQTSSAPLYRKNDFGGTIGGPVYIPGHYNQSKSKTFFFFSQEVRLEKSPDENCDGCGEFTQAVPSNAERGLSANGAPLGYADFSDVCPPGGGSTAGYPDCPALNGYGVAATNNQFPISPVAQSILNSNIFPLAVPGARCTGSTSCYAATLSPSTTWYEELFRIDHNLTDKEKLSFRFIHDSWNTTVLTPEWGTVLSNSFPSVLNQFNGPGLSMVAHLDQILSPTFLNQLSVSYTDTHITLTDEAGANVNLTRPATLDALSPSACLAAEPACLGYIFNNGYGANLPGGVAKLPGVIIAGNNAEYGGNGFAVDTGYMPWSHRNPTFDIRDGLSKVIGKHTVQAGVQVVYSRQSETNGATGADTGDVQGLLTFNNVNNYLSTGNAFADFLVGPQPGRPDYYNGRLRYYQQDSTQNMYNLHYTVVEPYVQDDWRATPRLTVNMGIRFSLFGNWQMKQGQAWNWEQSSFNSELAAGTQVNPSNGQLVDRATGNPIPLNTNNLDPRITNGLVECGTQGTPSSCMSSHLFNPAPRIGFAWDPTGSGKTSIRAGYGVFFEHGTSSESNVGSLMGNAPLVLDMTQNFPGSYGAIGGTDPDVGQTGAWPLNVTSIPTKVTWPYIQQWSLGVQHQITSDTLVSFAYVGSKGTHLTVEEQINQLAPVPGSLNPFAAGQPITNATCAISGGSYQIGNNFVGPGDPAYVNLQAACVGVTPVIHGLPTSPTSPDVNTLREFAPGFASIYSPRNIASSNYHALQMTIQRNHGPLNLGVSYTYSHSIDSASGRYSASFVNAYDLAANRASSDFDERQILNINYVYKLPLLDWYAHLWNSLHCTKGDEEINTDCSKPGAVVSYSGPSKLMTQLFSGWNLSGITTFQSGTPFSVINGAGQSQSLPVDEGGISVLDNAGLALGMGADSYPDRVNGYGCNTLGSSIRTVGPLLRNPCDFAAPRGLTQGNAGRNALNNPGRANFDMAIFRQMKVAGERTLEFRAEAFNIFNHTQFRIFDPDKGNTASNTISCYGPAAAGYSAGYPGGPKTTSCISDNGFLHPLEARRPRTMQFGVKFGF